MTLVHEGSTSPTLLGEVANWANHPAWVRFLGRYDPLMRRWCRSFGLDNDAVDEVCQLIWIELASRMKTFRYDPNRSFGSWLRKLCSSRTLDYLRHRKAFGLPSLDDREEAAQVDASLDAFETDLDGEAEEVSRLLLLDQAERVQAAVSARVKPQSWDAFWLVAVCDWKVEQTASALGMTLTAVYAARERIARMLREEGQRVSDLGPVGP